jgi:hypothetical protein
MMAVPARLRTVNFKYPDDEIDLAFDNPTLSRHS